MPLFCLCTFFFPHYFLRPIQLDLSNSVTVWRKVVVICLLEVFKVNLWRNISLDYWYWRFYFTCGCWEFQVTGRESLKTERPSRPVKIAESDADVSESFCSQDLKDNHPVYPSLLFFKISVSDFLQSTTEKIWLYCVV